MDRDGRLVDAELTKAETDGDPVFTEAVMSVVSVPTVFPPLPPAPPPTLVVLVEALLVVLDTAFISGA